jgi:hypothetical protein
MNIQKHYEKVNLWLMANQDKLPAEKLYIKISPRKIDESNGSLMGVELKAQ